MADPILLIVGLGNPGTQYAATRHNAGFQFLDAIVHDVGAELRREERFDGRTGTGRINSHAFRVLAPDTYMNCSGESVAKFTRFYKIPLQTTLVVHDDLDLPPGAVRLKRGGGHGGHNGLRDLFQRLGTQDFCRLRIGIGHPGSPDRVTDYVLSKAADEDQALIDEAIQAARRELANIVAGDFELAMNALHSET